MTCSTPGGSSCAPPSGAGVFRTLRVSGRQALITQRVSRVLGGAVDTTVTEWATSRGDLRWGNVTALRLSLLDWTGWGPAPRGNDAACLWSRAPAVPDTADRGTPSFATTSTAATNSRWSTWALSLWLRHGGTSGTRRTGVNGQSYGQDPRVSAARCGS